MHVLCINTYIVHTVWCIFIRYFLYIFINLSKYVYVPTKVHNIYKKKKKNKR